MPVASVIIPTRARGSFGMQCLLVSIQAEIVEVDGHDTYIDLTGRQDKIDILLDLPHVGLIEVNDMIPHEDPTYTTTGRSFH